MVYIFVSAIIVAGGNGVRIGGKIPKQFLCIEDKSIISITVEKFLNNDKIHEVIVVVNRNYLKYCSNIFKKLPKSKDFYIVCGGESRQKSVFNGLNKVNNNCDYVLIHDAVRPFILDLDINNLIDNIIEYRAVTLGVRVKDTIKVVDEDGISINTLNRDTLWNIQTPQCFNVDLIKSAHLKAEENKFIATDDCSLVEKLGEKVKIIEGNCFNIKITTREDLILAKEIFKNFSNTCTK